MRIKKHEIGLCVSIFFLCAIVAVVIYFFWTYNYLSKNVEAVRSSPHTQMEQVNANANSPDNDGSAQWIPTPNPTVPQVMSSTQQQQQSENMNFTPTIVPPFAGGGSGTDTTSLINQVMDYLSTDPNSLTNNTASDASSPGGYLESWNPLLGVDETNVLPVFNYHPTDANVAYRDPYVDPRFLTQQDIDTIMSEKYTKYIQSLNYNANTDDNDAIGKENEPQGIYSIPSTDI